MQQSVTKTRAAHHAGSWYTDDRKELDDELTTYLSKSKDVEGLKITQVKAVIAPHAGFAYSGPTAAWAFRYLKPETNLRVFLLGPSHKLPLRSCALSAMDSYETPIGNIQLDKEIIEELKNTGKFDTLKKKDEEDEHSLELLLPYTQKMLGSRPFKLVPIMVGSLTFEREEEYGKILRKYFDEDNTIFLFSSDFCHWGARFDYQFYRKEDGQIWQSIQKLDEKGMELIERHDTVKFAEYLNDTENTICGRHPIGIFLQMAKHSVKYATTLKTKFVQYAQSEKVNAPRSSSVSYASAISYI